MTTKSKIFAILAIVLIVLIVLFVARKPSKNEITNIGYEDPVSEVPVQSSNEISGNKGDLVSFSVNPGSKVSGVQIITGTVKNAYFFEGNIQVGLADANKNIVKGTYGTATTEWMTTGPVSFSSTIDATGMPKGPGYIQIHNDNASGLPENDKIIWIPVIFS